MSAPDWRHRAHAADDLLADIAAVCRGEMPAEAREGGSEAHRAAWDAVCALVAEIERLRAEVERERAAVVAYLRELGAINAMLSPYLGVADDIEDGEHRREEAE